jgi:hypothetical protein
MGLVQADAPHGALDRRAAYRPGCNTDGSHARSEIPNHRPHSSAIAYESHFSVRARRVADIYLSNIVHVLS